MVAHVAAVIGTESDIEESAGLRGHRYGRVVVAIGVARVQIGRLGHEHDGELESFRAVHRHDPHGRPVGLEPAGSVAVVSAAGVGDVLVEPAGQCRGAESFSDLDGVQQFRDVAQVGEAALPIGLGKHPAGDVEPVEQRFEGSRDALVVQHLRDGPHLVGEVVEAGVGGLPVGGPRVVVEAPPHQVAERRPGEVSGRRVDEGRQHDLPVVRRRRTEHGVGTAEHRVDADSRQCPLHLEATLVAPHEHGDVACAEGAPAAVGTADLPRTVEQQADLGTQVVVDQPAGRGGAQGSLGRHAMHLDLRAGSTPLASQRCRCVACFDGRHDDLRIAQGGTPEQVGQSAHHPRVAAVVDRQREHRVGRRDRGQVCHHIGVAEGIDRLLGVADQHHGGAAHESPLDDRPLGQVGVLELVDQHEREPARQRLAGERAGVGVDQGRAQARHHVVEPVDAEQPLATIELRADERREPMPADGERVVAGGQQG